MFWRRWQVLETFFKQKSQRASKVCCFKNKLEITATIALFLLKHFSAPKCNPEGFLKARPSQYLGTWQCISTVRIQIYFFSGCSFFARFHPEFLLSLKFIIPPKKEKATVIDFIRVINQSFMSSIQAIHVYLINKMVPQKNNH